MSFCARTESQRWLNNYDLVVRSRKYLRRSLNYGSWLRLCLLVVGSLCLSLRCTGLGHGPETCASEGLLIAASIR